MITFQTNGNLSNMTLNIQLFNESCFDAFKKLPDQSVDMVCVDPPYGTTTIDWDKTLDFELMWKELERIVKPNGNIIMFGSQPFTSLLIVSKLDWFRYELVWNKNKCGSPGLSKYRPQKVHENIMIFSKKSGGTYNPIMEEGGAYRREAKDKEKGYGKGINRHGYGFKQNNNGVSENHGTRFPKSILHGSRNFSAQQTVHPTQKPTNVLNWLIMTYSNPGDTVIDFTMGSGSCGVAAKLTGRNFIGVEQDSEYFAIAKSRIEATEAAIVGPENKQLSTQLPEGIQTTPGEKYEQGTLEKLRDGTYSSEEPDTSTDVQKNPLFKFE
jgi:site-specific DNA-methyltransferase (adenine-specific)